jgi:FKBP-type peptidyl-prolyl cis-trans isomerase 2
VTFEGYFADGLVFIKQETPVNIILGDHRTPYGLWKAIEHMRRGEKAKVMIKPRWAYGRDSD